MSQQQSADAGSDQPAVIELGGSAAPGRGGWRWASGITHNQWLVPLTAGFGAVAAFTSLVSDWQITRLRLDRVGSQDAQQQVSVGVAWLGGWSPAYLTGILALTSCVVLVLFGQRKIRAQVRLVGLAVSGVVLAVLVALTADLGRYSAAYNGIRFADPQEGERLDLTYGHGLSAAFVAVASFALALHLAGRLGAEGPASRVEAAEAAPDGGAHPSTDVDWPWQRRAPKEREGEPDHGSPLDLTVQPAKPFLPRRQESESR